MYLIRVGVRSTCQSSKCSAMYFTFRSDLVKHQRKAEKSPTKWLRVGVGVGELANHRKVYELSLIRISLKELLFHVNIARLCYDIQETEITTKEMLSINKHGCISFCQHWPDVYEKDVVGKINATFHFGHLLEVSDDLVVQKVRIILRNVTRLQLKTRTQKLLPEGYCLWRRSSFPRNQSVED